MTDVSRKKFKMKLKKGDEEKTPFRAGGILESGGDRHIDRGGHQDGDNYRRGRMT